MTAACLAWIGCNPPIASKNWSKEGKAGAAHCALRVRFLFDRAQCNTKIRARYFRKSEGIIPCTQPNHPTPQKLRE